MAPRLKERYRSEILPELMREFSYANVMQAPRVEKVTLNIGLGEARENARAVDSATSDLATITGQKPVVTKAKRAIANFKIREGMNVGASVTLRGDRMYEFLDRMLNAALPRIRDFHGVPTKAFDGRGNFSLGVREQLIFPEIDYDKVDRIRGMQVNIVTTAKTDEEGRRLLELMGMPFAKDRT
ncbi:MAG: 50S ribosomal protein L5 [Dehalococcoidia bacterium]|nr:50S ribosomal protein L5 [Dehalococcoidia bacterium]